MRVAVGVDIEKIERIKKLYELYGDRFVKRIFSEDEFDYLNRKTDPSPHLAGMWAAKEACIKVFGRISPKKVSIMHEESGKPKLVLPENVAKRVISVDVSISHTGEYAVAAVVALLAD